MAENENENPDKSKDNIFDDSFFDSLNDIDDGLSGTNFQKLENENINEIQDIEKDLKEPKKSEVKLNSKVLPVTKISQAKGKETDEMNKNKTPFDPLDLPADDADANKFNEIWNDMNRPDISDFKLMAIRTEPSTIKGVKISGYLETFHLPTSIPEIIEKLGQKYGGGRYSIRIVDGSGKYVKQKTFEISGLPKIPEPTVEASSQSVTATLPPPPKIEEKKKDDEEDTWGDELDEEEYDPTPRRRLRPFPTGGMNDNYRRDMQDQNIFGRPSVFKDESETKEVKEKVSNLENKLDRISDAIQNSKNNNKLFDPDLVKALAPVVVTWLDSKGSRDNASVSQFSEMNKQIVGLMQGMQDLVRLGDKAKDDLSEKERKEREQNRREMFDYQRQMEHKFIEEQRKAEERHQAMLLQLRESLENKHTQSLDSVDKNRLEYEKLRQEFREREEKLREEARIRDENARNRELETKDRARVEEQRWREELQRRDEETRRRELEWREEIRQKEIAAINDSKLRELEIMKQMREMDHQKTEMQQKLIEQVYSNNNNNNESQLRMELAIAKMTNDNEARMLQSNAEMQLEKIRHATQMQMSKMKSDLTLIENKKSEDPLDAAMQDYLKRKLQIDMIKELNMEVDEGDIPGSSLSTMLKKLAEFGGPMLMKILMGGGGMPNQMPGPGRVINPNQAQNIPVSDKVTSEEDIIFEEGSIDDVDEDEEETEETEEASDTPDLSNIDPMQEIPRVSEYFQYLKVAIEGGTITPEEAANEAKVKLSPQIVDYLSNITDSKIVINQLFPLLSSMGENFANFFTQPNSLEWLNKMLSIMNKSIGKSETAEEKPVETKTPVVEVNPKDKVEQPKAEQSDTPVKEKKKKQKTNV